MTRDRIKFLAGLAIAIALVAGADYLLTREPARAALVDGGTNQDLGAVINLSGATGPGYSADLRNPSAHEARVVVQLAQVSGTVTFTIYGKDGASGQYYALLQSAALNAAGQTVLEVGPGLTAASNTVANDYLPPLWRVGYTVSDGGSATASVGASTVE